MKINSANLFNAIYNAADAAGYLGELKAIRNKAVWHDVIEIDYSTETTLSVECKIDYDYDEADIILYICYGDVLERFACIQCPDEGPKTYRALGAAAALMQFVGSEMLLRMYWRDKPENPMTEDAVLDKYVTLLADASKEQRPATVCVRYARSSNYQEDEYHEIHQYPNGCYYNHYDVRPDHCLKFRPICITGPFASLEEAQAMMKKRYPTSHAL